MALVVTRENSGVHLKKNQSSKSENLECYTAVSVMYVQKIYCKPG